MTIHVISKTDKLWLPVANYAGTSSWDACVRMATRMKKGRFNDWERIFVAEEDGSYVGFCALIKSQDFPGKEYDPLIKWLFVDEKYRRQRLSQRLIDAASEYAKQIGFNQIFLTT